MKFFIALLFLGLSTTGFSQLTTKVQWTRQTSLPAADVIYYDAAKPLVWDNFMCTPPEDNSRVAAITMSGFGYTANMRLSGGKGLLTIQVYCFFNKTKSWVKAGKTTSYILRHEQHHFDVSSIAANIFVDKIQNAVMTPSNYNTILPRIYTECIDIMNKMQDEYDGQTRNGQDKDIQEKWNKFIDDKIVLITK